MRFVNESRKNIGLSLVLKAARHNEWRGNACLSGVAYEVSTGYIARLREAGSSALQIEKLMRIQTKYLTENLGK